MAAILGARRSSRRSGRSGCGSRASPIASRRPRPRNLGGSYARLRPDPYPLPSEKATLVEQGPYRFVRHPIYVAGVLVFLGYGCISSVPATAVVPLLAVLWHFKAGVEERHLAERFPGYDDYRRRVPAASRSRAG